MNSPFLVSFCAGQRAWLTLLPHCSPLGLCDVLGNAVGIKERHSHTDAVHPYEYICLYHSKGWPSAILLFPSDVYLCNQNSNCVEYSKYWLGKIKYCYNMS